jgi:hypothetical protein
MVHTYSTNADRIWAAFSILVEFSLFNNNKMNKLQIQYIYLGKDFLSPFKRSFFSQTGLEGSGKNPKYGFFSIVLQAQ